MKSRCNFLEGENIAPRNNSEAKRLIGKEVIYLRRGDIDRSGRGYFFPQKGKVVNVKGLNMAIDYPENWVIYINQLSEMVETKSSKVGG